MPGPRMMARCDAWRLPGRVPELGEEVCRTLAREWRAVAAQCRNGSSRYATGGRSTAAKQACIVIAEELAGRAEIGLFDRAKAWLTWSLRGVANPHSIVAHRAHREHFAKASRTKDALARAGIAWPTQRMRTKLPTIAGGEDLIEAILSQRLDELIKGMGWITSIKRNDPGVGLL